MSTKVRAEGYFHHILQEQSHFATTAIAPLVVI